MKCDQCGHGESEVLETRAKDFTVQRKRKCKGCSGTWVTLEVYRQATKNDRLRTRVDNQARWGVSKIMRNARDKVIAEKLHLGWEPLAKEYGLTKTAIYYAAARGRALNGNAHQNARSYKKDSV